MRKRPGEKRDNWLLIKSDDEAARGPNDPDILEEKPKSVVSGRTIEAIAKAEGDAVWQSNKSVAENVKQIEEGGEDSGKEGGAKEEGRQEAPGRPKRSRARISRPPRCCARQPARHARALPDFVPPQLATPAATSAPERRRAGSTR